MAIVTQEEAADHLRIILQTDDASPPVVDDPRLGDLTAKIAMAEAMVLDYIEKTEADLTESGVSANWLPVIRSAVLVILSGLWDDRVGSAGGDYFAKDGAVARILSRIKPPTIA